MADGEHLGTDSALGGLLAVKVLTLSSLRQALLCLLT